MDVTMQKRTLAGRAGVRPWCVGTTSVERDAIAFQGVAGSCGAAWMGSFLLHSRSGEGFPSQVEVLGIWRP